jgi:hypothetical protein
MKKSYLIFPVTVAFLIWGAFWTSKKAQKLSQPVNFMEDSHPIIMDNPELSNPPTPEKTAVITEEAPKNEKIPDKYLNILAFSSQAPYFKWDNLHDEACEEASLLMTHNYLVGTAELEIRTAEDEIQKMVTFQKSYFGSHKDLTAEEMIDLAEEFYEEKYQLIELVPKKIIDEEETADSAEPRNADFSEEENSPTEVDLEKIEYMKKELSKGNLFIAPMAGRELENPYFRVPGPLYHVLVVIGYDDFKKEFITHDPGTRRGENYHYSYEIIWKAIHDFPGKKSDILEGTKNVILIKK